MESNALAPGWSPPRDTRFRRRILYLRHLLKGALLIRGGFPLCTLGEKNTGCGWTFSPAGLGPDSIVYSGGVGNDITFEHALVKQFGCTVHLVDPTPTGMATMKLRENQLQQLKFLPVGLAGHCGTLRFAPPLHPGEGSWFSTAEAPGAIEARCLDLATLLAQNHHQRVDLLKLDIEGAEYGVIDHLLDQRIPVGQILVEFHDGLLPGIGQRQTWGAILKLTRRGYKLIAEVGNNHTFVCPRAPVPKRS